MPDLLLELFSEEIPARMQRQAAEDLKRLVTNALVERNLLYEGAQAFVTPRRLTLHVVGLPARAADGARGAERAARRRAGSRHRRLPQERGTCAHRGREDREGPEEGRVLRRGGREARPQHARSAGRDHSRDHPRFPVAEVDALGRCFREAGRSALGPPFARHPLHASARRHDAAEIVAFEVDGVASGDTTYGHRFMAPEPIKARRFDDYAAALQKAKVVLDIDRRKQIILADAKNLAFAQGLELIEDEGLLEEVAGLVEWPVVLLGTFEKDFLDIPPEVIRATIRANQKCFVLQHATRTRGRLANTFILVSNLVASDGGEAIAAGNAQRRARPPLGRAPFLADRPRSLARLQGQGREAARPAARQARSARHRVPREARDAGRAHRAYRGAG